MAVFPAFFGLLMAVLVSALAAQSVDITPREAVRRVGDELTVLCKVPYPIDSCRMTVGTTPYRLLPDVQEGDVVYAGQGLLVGECGARILHIREEWNGNISCTLPPRTGSIELTGVMRLVVARAPAALQLLTAPPPPPRAAFRAGDTLQTQCVAPPARPAARLSWFLDEEPLLVGAHQPVLETEPGTDLVSVRQNLTRVLGADDAGRRLVCRAEHEALPAPRDASLQLVVHYPPVRAAGEPAQLTVFGLALGAEGRLNVTLRASPAPRAEWTVAGERLVAPQRSATGGLEALAPLSLGGGFYNVTLVLERVTKEDVERTYLLRASTELGHDEVSLRISTMDEPAGVELEAGAIVGIVVAALLLLLALSLVVFARATERWCFAGRARRSELPDADSEAPLPPRDEPKGAENPSHEHHHHHEHADYIGNGNGDTKLPEKKPDTAV